MRRVAAAGRTEREVGRDIADAILAAGHATGRLRHRRAAGPTAPARTTSCPTGSSRPATRSSSTSAARCRRATAPTRPATYAVGEPRRRVPRATTRCCRRRRRRRAPGPGRASPAPASTRPPATSSRRPATASCSSTAPATASAWRRTRTPTSSPATTLLLEPGMAFSIEPGIYLRRPARRAHRGHRRRHRRRRRAAQPAPARARRPGGLTPDPTPAVDPRDPARRRRRPSCSTSTRELAAAELAPRRRRVRGARRGSRARCSAPSARPGCSGLPYPEEHGGGGQPYEVYLQVLEELAAAWLTVGIGRQRAHAGLPPGGRRSAPTTQRERLAAGHARRRAAGRLLPVRAAVRLRRRGAARPGPRRDGDELLVVDGTKAWITHGGEADFYDRDGPHRRSRARAGISLPARRRRHAGAVGGAARAQDGRQRLDRPRRSSSTAPGSPPTG